MVPQKPKYQISQIFHDEDVFKDYLFKKPNNRNAYIIFCFFPHPIHTLVIAIIDFDIKFYPFL